MIISYEIYWDDLNESAQRRLIEEGFIIDEDIIPRQNSYIEPIAIIEQEEEED